MTGPYYNPSEELPGDAGARQIEKRAFAREFVALQPLVDAGLVQVNDSGLQVTARGWYLVRAIAMVFDRYLQTDQDRARFSKII